MNNWYEDVVRGICIALLSGGTVKYLTDKNLDSWSITPIVVGGLGLLILAYVRKKCTK